MNQQSLNNGEEEKTAELNSLAQPSEEKLVIRGPEDEALSLFVACEGQALDMYRENFGVTFEDSLMQPRSDQITTVPRYQAHNPLAALDAVINSIDDGGVSASKAAAASKAADNLDSYLASLKSESMALASSLTEPVVSFESRDNEDTKVEVSIDSLEFTESVELEEETEAAATEQADTSAPKWASLAVDSNRKWTDDQSKSMEAFFLGIAKEEPVLKSQNVGGEALTRDEETLETEQTESTVQPGSFEFESTMMSAPGASAEQESFYYADAGSMLDQFGLTETYDEPGSDDSSYSRAQLEEQTLVDEAPHAVRSWTEAEEGGVPVIPGAVPGGWGDLSEASVQSSQEVLSDRLSDDTSSLESPSETAFPSDTAVFEVRSGYEPALESPVLDAPIVDESSLVNVLSSPAETSDAALKPLEPATEGVSQFSSMVEPLVLHDEMPPATQSESNGISAEAQNSQPEPLVADKLDMAIDMFEDFLDSDDASVLIKELGESSQSDVVDPASPAGKPAKEVDTNALERAIDMLEESLFEEAQVSARIHEALQARRQGNALRRTEANWVIPLEGLPAASSPDVWSLASRETNTPVSGKETLIDIAAVAPPIDPVAQHFGKEGISSGGNSSALELLHEADEWARNNNAHTEADSVAESTEAAPESSPRDSMNGIPLRPNFTIVSQEQSIFAPPDASEENFAVATVEEPGMVPVVSTEGIIRAVKSLEEARELSIDSDNFVGLQDAAFGAPNKKTTREIVKEEMLKTGERSVPRPSQEFLRIKAEDFSNQQELSQKLRALPLPSAEEKKEKDKPVRPLELVAKHWTRVKTACVSLLALVIVVWCLLAKTSGTYLEEGKRAYEKGHYVAAVKALQSSLSLDPGQIPAMVYLARSNFALHQTEEALDRFGRILKLQPNNWDALQGRAAIYASRKDWMLALSDLREMVVIAPTKLKAREWVWYGTALAGTGDGPGAAEAFSMAIKLDPGLRDARVGRIRALRRSNRVTEAITEANTYLETSPGDREVRLELARALTEKQDFDTALLLLKALAEGHSRDASVHFEMGRAYAGRNDERSAIREFDLALRSLPTLAPEVSSERLKLTKRIEEARHNALSQNPSYVPPAVHPLMLEMAREQQECAIPKREKPVVLPPGVSASDAVGVGYSQMSRGKYDDAIRTLNASVMANPSDVNARRYLAEALARGKRPDEARAQYEAIWNSQGWSARDEAVLAAGYDRAGQLDRSAQSWEKITKSATAGTPTYMDASYQWASVLLRVGMKAQAAEVCRQGQAYARSGADIDRFGRLMSTLSR